jgi:hypothetical protein
LDEVVQWMMSGPPSLRGVAGTEEMRMRFQEIMEKNEQ